MNSSLQHVVSSSAHKSPNGYNGGTWNVDQRRQPRKEPRRLDVRTILLVLAVFVSLSQVFHPWQQLMIDESIQIGDITDSIIKRPLVESYTIGFHLGSYQKFLQRNEHVANLSPPPAWVHATDGFNQRTLNIWKDLTSNENEELKDEPVIQLADYLTEEKQKDPLGPHAVGCFLSHWNLWRILNHRHAFTHPSFAYLIFEDDASCSPDSHDKLIQVIQDLRRDRKDWDLIYLGGKPFTHFRSELNPDTNNNDTNAIPSEEELRERSCIGTYGEGDSPMAPDGTRNHLHKIQTYYQINYITNTHAYAINPTSLPKLLQELDPKRRKRHGWDNDIAVDLRIAYAVLKGQLTAFMPPKMYCDGPNDPSYNHTQNGIKTSPSKWTGFYVFTEESSVSLRYQYLDEGIILEEEECDGNY